MTLGGKFSGAKGSLGTAVILLGSVAALTPASGQGSDTQSRGVIVLRPTAATPVASVANETTAPAVTTGTTALTPAVLQPKPAMAGPAVSVTSPAVATAVSSVGTTSAGPVACARPFAQPSLQLGQAQFDKRLTKLLKGKAASAVIDLPQPYAVTTAAPPSLAGWLSEVKASGGFVSVNEYCQQSRGMFSFLRKMFAGGAKDAYKAAAGYDAVLHTNGADQLVTQIEFKRRAS